MGLLQELSVRQLTRRTDEEHDGRVGQPGEEQCSM